MKVACRLDVAWRWEVAWRWDSVLSKAKCGSVLGQLARAWDGLVSGPFWADYVHC